MIDTLQSSNTNSIIGTKNYGIEPLLKNEIEDMSVFEGGHLFSIELKRQKVKSGLNELFDFKSSTLEIDYIAQNEDVLKLLPSIGGSLKNSFGIESTLMLELLREENDWRTLFINVTPSDEKEWEFINDFKDTFFDNMFDMFPSVAEKINIDIY